MLANNANGDIVTTTNPLPVKVMQTVSITNQGKLWFFQVAEGSVAGTTSVFKAGYNPSCANGSEESLWGASNLYPWSAWNSGGTLSCVSTSSSDTGHLHITGLKADDWTETTEIVTLNGLTPVVTTNNFIRINNIHYFSSDVNVGAITASRGGTVVGYIEIGNGQGQMAQYTIPAGYTAYMLSGNSNVGKGNDGTGKFKYRLYGSNFQTAMTYLLYQSTFDYTFQTPLKLPEKTDLDVTLLASNAGTPCSCAYSMILIANS